MLPDSNTAAVSGSHVSWKFGSLKSWVTAARMAMRPEHGLSRARVVSSVMNSIQPSALRALVAAKKSRSALKRAAMESLLDSVLESAVDVCATATIPVETNNEQQMSVTARNERQDIDSSDQNRLTSDEFDALTIRERRVPCQVGPEGFTRIGPEQVVSTFRTLPRWQSAEAIE